MPTLFTQIDEEPKFSLRAPYINLREILSAIERGYTKQCDYFEEQISLLEIKDPQQYAEAISFIEKKIKDYQLKINLLSEGLAKKFSGSSAQSTRDLEAITDNVSTNINQANSISQVRKLALDGVHQLQDLLTTLSNNIKEYLTDQISEIEVNLRSEKKISLPGLDLDSIEAMAEEEAMEPVTVRKKMGFWKSLFTWTWGAARWYEEETGDYKVNQKKALENLKGMCTEEFNHRANHILRERANLIQGYRVYIKEAITDDINTRRNELDKKKKEKTSNEERAEKKELFETYLVDRKEILEEIKELHYNFGD